MMALAIQIVHPVMLIVVRERMLTQCIGRKIVCRMGAFAFHIVSQFSVPAAEDLMRTQSDIAR